MFLDIWMLSLLTFAFGLCAFFSTKSGFNRGVISTLAALEDEKLIIIHNDGSISPSNLKIRINKRTRKSKKV